MHFKLKFYLKCSYMIKWNISFFLNLLSFTFLIFDNFTSSSKSVWRTYITITYDNCSVFLINN